MLLVTAHHIQVVFGQQTILSDVDLSVQSGEIVTVIGPNGAGKSTLVRVALGLVIPTAGTVHIQPGIRIGYMPQSISIESCMPLPVSRFLALGGRIAAVELETVLALVRIKPLLSRPMQTLSAGEVQRVLLARALLRRPELLVLDEPVRGVDVMGQEELYRLILHIRNIYRCGILMVSHDLHVVMAGTDSVICLNTHVCCSGHPEAVSRHPEFLNLFGPRESAAALAFYAHHHNHRHDEAEGEGVC